MCSVYIFLNFNVSLKFLASGALISLPSEEDEDNAVFYDAQENDSYTLTFLNSLSRERDRTDSQGSDDGSSSECDPTVTADHTRNDTFLIVTDYESLPNSRVKSTELEKVSFIQNKNFILLIINFLSHKPLENLIMARNCTKRYLIFRKRFNFYIQKKGNTIKIFYFEKKDKIYGT